MAGAAAVERADPDDLTWLASDIGPAPANVGAVLVLDPTPDSDVSAVTSALIARAEGIGRLRQRLVSVPPGCGRPIWIDDPVFTPARQVEQVRYSPPGDREALLALAAEVVTQPLSRSRPLWRAVVVTGLADGRVGVIVVLHHVLADGIGGVAILSQLVDGADPRTVEPTGPPPHWSALMADATTARVRALAAAPAGVRRLWAALSELGAGRPARAPACSLNAPTGPRRQLATVEVDLAAVRSSARRHGATVNDVLLAATTRALETVLYERGETVPALVMSVPVAARETTTTAALGNAVGAMPIRVPLPDGPQCPLEHRLESIAAITRKQKTATRGASSVVIGPVFRLLARLGMLRRFIHRQRLVNSLVTNLPGPRVRLRLGGAEVSSVIPVSVAAGNLCVVFAALSYAGTLVTTVIVDPDRVGELPRLTTALDDAVRSLIVT